MKRIAVIDKSSKSLWVEDVTNEDLEKYNGSIEEYVKDTYDLSGDFAFSEILEADYVPAVYKMPTEIVFDMTE